MLYDLYNKSQIVGGASNSSSTPVQNMCVYHGSVEIFVPQQFLDGGNAVARFRRMPLVVVQNEALDPLNISLLSFRAVVLGANRRPNLIQ